MSASSFKSVFMVASCAGAALGCYLVSLRVATERAALEDVETQIVLAQRDLRLLQTEIGTRGRLAQLERWNAKVIALSAPTADQFLNGSFELAKLTTPETKPAVTVPVVLASAPKPEAAPIVGTEGEPEPERARVASPPSLMHQASFKQIDAPSRTAKPVVAPPKAEPKAEKPAPAADPKASPKPKGNVAAKSPAKPKAASGDPLAPLPIKASPQKLASLNKSANPARSSKDPAKQQ